MEEFIECWAAAAAEWIEEQRNSYRARAEPLSAAQKAEFSMFFDRQVLDTVKSARVPAISNPPFYTDLRQAGVTSLLDFSAMAGITFRDTILLAGDKVIGDRLQRLLFHELVHVVQYEVLGVKAFAFYYVEGWFANSQRYLDIPLERNAYSLDEQYWSAKTEEFSVRQEVTAFVASLNYKSDRFSGGVSLPQNE
jgi:hypothetical protein